MPENLLQDLRAALEKAESAEGGVMVDFSSVDRIDSRTLVAFEELAGMADKKAVKLVLRGVNVDVYKVLKLMKLSQRFSYVN